MKTDTRTTQNFLAEEVYMPGYMALRQEDYDTRGATFTFQVTEPPVARENVVHYFTPRGVHICISQAGYALVENLSRQGKTGDLSVDDLRKIFLEGRIRIIELFQRFDRELKVNKPIQGRIDLHRMRLGKLPMVKLDFAFENGAVYGDYTSVIAPTAQPQTNADIMRAA